MRSAKLSGRWKSPSLCVLYVRHSPMLALKCNVQPPSGVSKVSRASAAVSERIATSTEPIRNTVAYKAFADTIVDALDDSGSAKHAGFEEKETRRKRRQARLAKAGIGSMGKGKVRVKADPE